MREHYLTVAVLIFAVCLGALYPVCNFRNEQREVPVTSPAPSRSSCAAPSNVDFRSALHVPGCISISHVNSSGISARINASEADPLASSSSGNTIEITLSKAHDNIYRLYHTSIYQLPSPTSSIHFSNFSLPSDTDFLLSVWRGSKRRALLCRRAFSLPPSSDNLLRNAGFEQAGDSPYSATRFHSYSEHSPRRWTSFYDGLAALSCGPGGHASHRDFAPRTGNCTLRLGGLSFLDEPPDTRFHGAHQGVRVPHANAYVVGFWYRPDALLMQGARAEPQSASDALSAVVQWAWASRRDDSSSSFGAELRPQDGVTARIRLDEGSRREWRRLCVVLNVPRGERIRVMHLFIHRHDYDDGSLHVDDAFLSAMNDTRKVPLDCEVTVRPTPPPQESALRIAKNFPSLRALYRPTQMELTIAVPLTAERVLRLGALARKYGGGHVVAAVLVRGEDEVVKVKSIWREDTWLRTFVDIRFVRWPVHMLRQMPINALRNVALSLAETEFVTMLDVDMTPATNSFACFRETSGTYLNGLLPKGAKMLLALPVFIGNVHVQVAQNKTELLGMLGARAATSYCLDSQKSVRVARWYRREEPFETRFLKGYEPYAIGRRTEFPRFDERFEGYGFNKIAWTYAAEKMGYRFLVSHESFVNHLSHVENDWVDNICVQCYLQTWRRYLAMVTEMEEVEHSDD